MLNARQKGYAVMNEKLTAISIDGFDIETLKRYCRKGEVIVERIPQIIGYSLTILIYSYYKPISLRGHMKNIFWLHWCVNKEYQHKCGRVVYKPS